MAERVLALFGKGRGPKVPIHGRKAKAEVTGTVDTEVHFRVEHKDEETVVKVGEGIHELPEGSFVCAEFNGDAHGIMCFVRT